jgi:hypothetical protein
MKSLVVIACCLFLLIAGAASAFEPCNHGILSDRNHHHASSFSAHHSHSDDPYSGDTVIHCPTVSEFISTAIFSLKPHHRTDAMMQPVTADATSEFSGAGSSGLDHGPPSLHCRRLIPPQILFSIWRI